MKGFSSTHTMNIHDVTELKVGKWEKLGNETEMKEIGIRFDGKDFVITLFRDANPLK